MPVKQKNIQKTVINFYTIYVIADFDLNEFYVGNTRSNRLSAEYWSHFNKKNNYTKDLIENIQAIGKKLKMYFLTTVECTKIEANLFMLPYIKLFLDNGLTCLNRPQFVSLTESMEKGNMDLYLYLTQYKIEELCNQSTDLFPDYTRTMKKKKEKPDTITLRITEDQYLEIEEKAKKANKSVSKFCKEMALMDAHVVQIDYKNLTEHNKLLTEIRETLQQILYTIYKTQEYYSEDLKILQQIIDSVSQIEEKSKDTTIKELNKLYEVLP